MEIRLPSTINGELAWYGPDLAANPEKWVMELDDAEVLELSRAADKIISCGLSIVDINKQKFPLPLLESKLEELSAQLTAGIGFIVIKRIPVDSYSTEKAAIIFYGLGALRECTDAKR